jgi:hypothetical protein
MTCAKHFYYNTVVSPLEDSHLGEKHAKGFICLITIYVADGILVFMYSHSVTLHLNILYYLLTYARYTILHTGLLYLR